MSLLERFRFGGKVTAGPSTTPTAAECDSLRLIDEGNAFEDKGHLDAALECYEAAIRATPNLARAYLNRGNIFLAIGRGEDALEAYKTAVFHDPQYAAAHYNIGNVCMRLNRYADALVACRAAI